jgi:hypothetical protein
MDVPTTPRFHVHAEPEFDTPIRRPVTPTPPRRAFTLGPFMTPQHLPRISAMAKGRLSLGRIEEEPQRVTTETKWRVKDLLDPVREEGGEDGNPKQEAPQTPPRNRTATELERQVRSILWSSRTIFDVSSRL